jgi:hypothetical protein
VLGSSAVAAQLRRLGGVGGGGGPFVSCGVFFPLGGSPLLGYGKYKGEEAWLSVFHLYCFGVCFLIKKGDGTGADHGMTGEVKGS